MTNQTAANVEWERELKLSPSVKKIYFGAHRVAVVFFSALAIYPVLAISIGYWAGGVVAPAWQIVLFLTSVALAMGATFAASRVPVFIMPLDWGAIAVFAFVLHQRMEHNIYDLVNPTDLLGGVTRAANGLIPFSFANFPEFYANYHAAFIVAASALKQVFGLTAADSIALLYLFGLSALSFLALWWLRCILACGQVARIVFLTFLLFVSSIPIGRKVNVGSIQGAYAYLMPIDTMLSNSWVFGFILALALLILLDAQHKNASTPRGVAGGLVLSSMAIFANITVFVFGLATQLTSAVVNVRRESWKKLLGIALGSLFLWLFSKAMPSVNITGPKYASPLLSIRQFEDIFGAQVRESLRLAGVVTLVALVITVTETWRGRTQWFRSLAPSRIMFLGALAFLILIKVEGVSAWDAIHKTALLTMFVAAYIVITALATSTNRFAMTATITGILLLSYPNCVDFLKRSTSGSSESWRQYREWEKRTDVVALRKLPVSVMYPVDRVSLAEHSVSNSLAGHFTKNSFYPGFLVRVEASDWPNLDQFRNPSWFKAYIKASTRPAMLQVPNETLADFSAWFEREKSVFDFQLSWSGQTRIGGYVYIPIVWEKKGNTGP